MNTAILAGMALGATLTAADPTATVPLWPEGIPGTVDPVHGNDERTTASLAHVPVLQTYLVAADHPRPALIVFPGGGYGGRAGHEGEPLARWANTLGFQGFVCQYRVSPWRHPQPLNDLQRAVRMVRQHAKEWGVDPQRIAVMGFSAGGHLAASGACFGDDGNPQAPQEVDRQSSRVNALVACYPVISFGPLGHAGSRNNLLGKVQDPELVKRLSLENSVTAAHPPTFLWHTEDDSAVPVQNSQMYAKALEAVQVPVSLHLYPHGHHGLGMAAKDPVVSQWVPTCAEWLKSLGWIAP